MSLIKCPECGKEISDKSTSCPNCGCPVSVPKESDVFLDAKKFNKESKKIKKDSGGKGESGTARMTFGIILIVLSFIVGFQSCAAGMVNALESGSGNDGMIGFFTWIVMIVCGIVSITTRRTRSPKTPLIIGIILLVYGYLIGFMYNGIFKDLQIWGWLLMVGSLIYIKSYKAIKDNNKQN